MTATLTTTCDPECFLFAPHDGACQPREHVMAGTRFATVPNGFGGTTTVRVAPKAPAHRPNKYAGPCATCGTHVPANTGRIERSDGKWLVLHVEACQPTPAAAVVAPKAPAAPTQLLTPGMYRVGEAFYKVQASRETTNLYAKVLGGDADTGYHFDYAPGAIGTVRADGVRLTEAEASEFGRRTGTCCVCARLLTNPESIDLGIGPICRGKL